MLGLSLTLGNPTLNAGVPGWVPSGARYFADFVNGQYYARGVTDLAGASDFTRASVGTADTAAGVWSSFAVDAYRITDRGIRVEPARTNKCTNYNANPPQLLTPTTVAAFEAAFPALDAFDAGAGALFGCIDASGLLTAAGFGSLGNGRAYVIDNRAGSGVATVNVAGASGNTNAHSLSIVGWYDAGSSATMAFNPAGTSLGNINSATPARIKRENITPTDTARRLQVSAPIGSRVYFILSQVEEGPESTAPIVVDGASASRSEDMLVLEATGTNDWTVTFDNDATQDFLGVSGNFAVDADLLNRRVIKSIAGFF